MRYSALSLIVCLVLGHSSLAAAQPGRIQRSINIAGGDFVPLYGLKEKEAKAIVHSFRIDPVPVTNADYYQFIRSHPDWITPDPLFSARGYLSHWPESKGGRKPGTAQRLQPVVNVPWFAASAYCDWSGGRLPSVLEWEYVAAASETSRDASRDPQFVQRLLDWYAHPSAPGELPEVGKDKPNFWGLHNLHGAIWEWTGDFNSVFVSGDSRRESEQSKNLFCGAGAASATDKANYAAFMRYALRSSLSGSDANQTLGFRCAYDLPKPQLLGK